MVSLYNHYIFRSTDFIKIIIFISKYIKLKIEYLAFSSHGNHTGQLAHYNWLADTITLRQDY